MPFYKETTAITGVYKGTTAATAVYLGSTAIWLAGSPVAFLAATQDTATTNNTTTSNFSHAGGSGSNICAVVVVTGNGSNLSSAFAATYGGVSMTKQLGIRGDGNDNGANLVVFTLLNAGTGTKTVNVTCSVGTNIHDVSVFTYENVGSIGTVGTSTGSGGSMSVSAGSANTLGKVFAAFAVGDNSTTAISSFSGTERKNTVGDSSLGNRCMMSAGDSPSTGGTVTTTASHGGSGIVTAAGAFELVAA